MDIIEIKCGDSAQIEKEMKSDMVVQFASISEDFNPIHLNDDYAAQSRYKRRLIHGLMASSLFSGLFGTKLPGRGCVYKSQNLRFKRPIYVGDVVLAKIEVLEVDIESKNIKFATRCYVKNKMVIDGEAEIFVP